MHDRIDNPLVFNLKGQLFKTLALKSLFGSFTGLYLAAHELP